MGNEALNTTEGVPPALELVESGIYRKTANGVYYERPFIDGKRTWRSLQTSNLKHAREELHKRRAGVSGNQKPESVVELRTVGEIIRRNQKDGYLDKHLQLRTGRTLEEEERTCKNLLEFWNSIQVPNFSDALCDKYSDWRKRRIQQGTGERAVDRDLNSLNNAFRYAKRRGLVRYNPLVDRPNYQSAKMVKHCRDFMPGGAAGRSGRMSRNAKSFWKRCRRWSMIRKWSYGLATNAGSRAIRDRAAAGSSRASAAPGPIWGITFARMSLAL